MLYLFLIEHPIIYTLIAITIGAIGALMIGIPMLTRHKEDVRRINLAEIVAVVITASIAMMFIVYMYLRITQGTESIGLLLESVGAYCVFSIIKDKDVFFKLIEAYKKK